MSSILMFFSIVFIIPVAVALIYGERFDGFVLASAISLVLGLLFKFTTKNIVAELNVYRAMYFTTIAWVLLSIIGAIPYLIHLDKAFVDAFFESVSGFTTTGITVFVGLDDMDNAVMLWRSITQWLGGLGILTFFLFVTTSSEGEMWQLFSAEGHKIVSSRPVPNVFSTIRIFWSIYGILTIIECVILKILGLDFFDSIIHSFTTISTGGFSNHDLSIGYYKSMGYVNYKEIEYIILFFMLLGGINFLVHYRFLKGKRSIYFKDHETKSYIKIIFGSLILTLFGIYILRGISFSELEEVIRNSLFQIVAIITSTGFGTVDIGSDFFPTVSKLIFVLLMILGGCVGSTSGGLKVIRILILEKIFKREINKLRLPRNAVIPVSIDGSIISTSELTRVSALVFGWIALIMVGSFITVLFSDLGAFEGFSGMTSAVGNMGPFYFSVDKMASLNSIIKYTYIFGMFAGRLELLPLFILFSKSMTRRR